MNGPSGVIGAMPEELEQLLGALERAGGPERAGPFALHRGRLEDRPVIVARCGIGKVNAAALTQALLSAGAERIVFTGVAGGVDGRLRVGDIVISRDAVQHDVDVTPLGYEPGEVPESGRVWTADAALADAALAAANEIEGVTALLGRVASADRFVADPERARWLREAFGASCAEMEGAAAAQVCAAWGAPWVVIRSISDSADRAAETDFRAFTALAAERAERVVRGVLRRLPA